MTLRETPLKGSGQELQAGAEVSKGRGIWTFCPAWEKDLAQLKGSGLIKLEN